jgi:hypothetical protein
MRRTTTTLFMLVSMFAAAATTFAGQVNAGHTIASETSQAEAAAKQESRLMTTTTGTFAANCCTNYSAVTFQNYTLLKIQCYVDGSFVGMVYPGQTLTAWARSGWTRPYAQAVFDNGAVVKWDIGNVFYVPGGSYAFPMYP